MTEIPGAVRLDGRAIVVSGAGRGIGEACARLAAQLGASVIVNDLDAASAERVAASIRDSGARAHAHGGDIAVRAEAAAVVERCVRELGRIDGLVNNAAVMVLGQLDTYDENRLRDLLDVNVVGGFNLAAAAVPHMRAQRSGSVVNMTSGAHLGLADMSEYAASKGAVASMTYAWAEDLAGSGVRVNAVAPLAASVMSDDAQSYLAATGQGHRVIDAPDPAANAPAVCYLLSDASRPVHGQVVRIAGTVLSLMSHPAILEPLLARPDWTVDDVARAFAEHLTVRQVPTGMAWSADPPRRRAPATLPFP